MERAKGNGINQLGIFDSKWRCYMGEYFMVFALMIIPTTIACCFMLIHGIVLSLAWSLSYYILFEKGKNPVQAIKASNYTTYGSKWMMFITSFALMFVLMIIFTSLVCIVWSMYPTIGIIAISTIGLLIFMPLVTALNASIWRHLQGNVE